MTKRTDESGTGLFEQWLQTDRGRSAESWQAEILARETFPGAPSLTTYDLLLDALRTVRVRKP